MAPQAPRRKGQVALDPVESKREIVATVESKEAAQAAKTKIKDSIAIGNIVEYHGQAALVTGEDKPDAMVYLDTPICAWVSKAECAAV